MAVDTDEWGIPYKVVMKKLGCQPPGAAVSGREVEISGRSCYELEWLCCPSWRRRRSAFNSYHASFTSDELERAARRLPGEKAPGPDCISNEVLAVVARRKSELFLIVYNKCLMQGVFSSQWKHYSYFCTKGRTNQLAHRRAFDHYRSLIGQGSCLRG